MFPQRTDGRTEGVQTVGARGSQGRADGRKHDWPNRHEDETAHWQEISDEKNVLDRVHLSMYTEMYCC